MSKSIDSAKQQHQIIGVSSSTICEYNPHSDAQWFKNGGNLGLFIHFGISVVSSKVDLSWGMMANKPWEERMNVDYTITPNEYFSLAKYFKPENYNPKKWMKAIKEAGFSYAVFTTRHHDGFAMWPTNYGEFNTKNYLGGFDFVKEYVEACREYDIRVGLYYSPPDWYYNREYMSFNYGSVAGATATTFSGREHFDCNHKPIEIKSKPQGFEDDFTQYVTNQIKELITNYGKIDMLWFDGSIEQFNKVISIKEIREAQPGIIVNPRLHHTGDFETFECRMPTTKPEHTWEHEWIWADGPWWGYMEQSKGYQATKILKEIYQKVKEWEGNLLVNVGPMKNGELPQEVYEKLKNKDVRDCSNLPF